MLTKIVGLFLGLLLLTGCTKANDKVTVSVDLGQGGSVQSQTVVTTSSPSTGATAPVPTSVDQPKPTLTNQEISSSVNWPVAFASQAPLGNWDHPYDEACEEASMIGVWHYYNRQGLTNDIMDQKIQAVVAWQAARGYRVDLSASETMAVLRDYYGIKSHLVYEVTVDRLKYELAQNHLILVPAAGRLLGNPNFQQPGPIYHMLILRGYNDQEFITNDPGTRRGDGFRYKYSTLINAVHDWNHQLGDDGMADTEIAQGARVVVVVDGLVDDVTAGKEVVD